jgi:hypothetical protein
MCVAISGDVVAHTRCQQRPEHIRECEQKQPTSAKGVNRPHSWPREKEVDKAEAERGKQSLLLSRAAFFENGRRVECDDVDCTWLVTACFLRFMEAYFRTSADRS